MSGYDPRTGWTHFTPTKVTRQARHVEGQSDDLNVRMNDTLLDWYWDAAGGLHVHCDDGRLWEILSGEPATRTSASPSDPGTEPEWLSVTDLGAAVADPPLGSSTVLSLLRKAGLLERVDGKDVPTGTAAGLFEEREPSPSSRLASKPGAVQRRWAYSVVGTLRTAHQQTSR